MKISAGVFFILFSGVLNAQTPEKSLLRFQSYAYALCVTGNEQLFITTKAGEVAQSPSINEPWHFSSPVNKGEIVSNSSAIFEQANFFNNDTGFISGFVRGDNGNYNIIYHTIDNGKSWKPINFGQSGWVDHAVNLNNGKAWLSVAGSGIAYTNNYGFSWKKFKIPDITQRFAQIYFNEKEEGLIGSLWNMIAYTSDNCASWKILSTPLDQNKYSKTNPGVRPSIDRVGIYRNFLIVNQENMIFYRDKDSSNWNLLPAYSDFYTDASNSAIYFKTNKQKIIRANEYLQPLYEFNIDFTIYDGKCINGGLFLMCGDKLLQIKNENTTTTQFIYSGKPDDIEPISFGYSNQLMYGSIGSRIFSRKNSEDKWEYEFDLPFNTDSGYIQLIDGNRILYTLPNDSLFYYSLLTRKTIVASKRMLLNNFCNSHITKIMFEQGSMGCFHRNSRQLIYEDNGDEFELTDKLSDGFKNKSYLPDNNEIISKTYISNFVKKIPSLINKRATFNDLGFGERDYQQCKSDILKFKNSIGNQKKLDKCIFKMDENNIDFDRLIKLVDSVQEIPQENLSYQLENLSNMWSTTSNWTQVSFENEKGELLTIRNSSYESNAFYLPWIISLDGYQAINVSVDVYKFIQGCYPAFLPQKDKVEILRTLIKRIY